MVSEYSKNISSKIETINWIDSTSKENFEELIEKIRIAEEKQFGVFIGAGVSSKYYPELSDTTRRICDLCGVTILMKDDDNILENAPDILENCLKKNSQQYFDALYDVFKPLQKEGQLSVDLIQILQLKFKGSFVTTNIDPLIPEIVRKISGCNINKQIFLPNHLDITRFSERNIYYIHGIADYEGERYIEHTVFASSQYEVQYGQDGDVREFLRGVFKSCVFLFLGFSLREKPIKEILETIKKWRNDRKKDDPSYGEEILGYIFLPSEIYVDEDGKFYIKDKIISVESKEYKFFSTKEQQQCLEYKRLYGIKIIRYYRHKSDEYRDFRGLVNNLSAYANLEHIPRKEE